MRHAGTIPNQAQAELLANYLFAKGIDARVDPDGDQFAVWIRNEEQVDEAKAELREFLADPENEKYRAAAAEAREKRLALEKQQRRVERNTIDMRQRWRPSPLRSAPATIALLGISILVTLLTWFGESRKDAEELSLRVIQAVRFSNPTAARPAELDEYTSNLPPAFNAVLAGQVWRLITPIFWHLSIWHLLFNMLMLRDLGALVETRIGTGRFLVMVLALAAFSNCAQAWENPNFGGMSGVLYGLFGYAWMKSRFDPAAGIFLPDNLIVLLVVWYFLCLFGLIGDGLIANTAHTAGLVGGIVIGYFPVAMRKVLNR